MEPARFNQFRSLRHFPGEPQPGTLSVLTVSENLVVPPTPNAELSFGRNRLAVDLCIGENDVRISRLHGTISYDQGYWWLRNHGRLPLRISSGVLLHTGSEPLPLANGYTTIFLRGNRQREHLLEVLISDGEDRAANPRPNQLTVPPKRWRLTPEEHLTLTVLAQRYLAYDLRPLPLTKQQAATELAELRPQETWTAKRVEHIVSRLRQRLSDAGVAGLRRDEVGEPVGVALTVNLIWELVQSTSLVPMDLEWLELAGQDPSS